MPATTYLLDNLIDHSLGTLPYSSPAQVYIALFTSAPNKGGGGTEVSTSGTGYGRIAIDFSLSSVEQSSNTNACLFTCVGTTFGTITHYALFDAISAGNMLYYGTLSSPATILDGDSYNVPIGAVVIDGE